MNSIGINSYFMGMRVLTSPYVGPVPKIQLSYDFTACTEKCKADTNAWLLERFGTKEVFYMIGNDALVLSPTSMATLRAAASRMEKFIR